MSVFLAIDLKSFYASVECIDRGLDPLKDNLVVADITKTEKTICLAVSPALKALGIPGRARLYEVMQKAQNTDLTIASPRMARYVEMSTKIFGIYAKFVSPEDIHVYSVDEVFMDITHYLEMYHQTPHELAITIIRQVLKETSITATAGIGTNLYLAKVAMDIVAKHLPADQDGVRIAELDEHSYREQLWDHQPLTDFWRIGKGLSRRLGNLGIHTMGDLANYSLTGSEKLYKTFGINAELMIDHAWGWEPTTMADIKNYQSDNHSLCSGQVLKEPYDYEKTRIVVQEMADQLALDLFAKQLYTDQLVLQIGYDVENLKHKNFNDEIATDFYNRKIPKPAHGSINLPQATMSAKTITKSTLELFDKIINRDYTVRRLYLTANHVKAERESSNQQLDMFRNYEAEAKTEAKDQQLQSAILALKEKYGKNIVLKAISLEEGATAIERNSQIGGHRA